MIIAYFLFLLTFMIGYALGVYHKSPEILAETKKRIQKRFDREPVGAVKRLTAEEQRKKGTSIERAEKEMEKTLDKIL